jgi:hypothetical protein
LVHLLPSFLLILLPIISLLQQIHLIPQLSKYDKMFIKNPSSGLERWHNYLLFRKSKLQVS